MKTVTKLAAATVLALSTLAPALVNAQNVAQDARADRNASAYTATTRQQKMQDARGVSHRTPRGTNAFAAEPAPASGQDFSILSQH